MGTFSNRGQQRQQCLNIMQSANGRWKADIYNMKYKSILCKCGIASSLYHKIQHNKIHTLHAVQSLLQDTMHLLSVQCTFDV